MKKHLLVNVVRITDRFEKNEILIKKEMERLRGQGDPNGTGSTGDDDSEDWNP